MFFAVKLSLDELRERLRDEEVEEEDDGEEMPETDIEISRDREKDVECNKSSDRPFGGFCMEACEERFESA